jgi:hypothetical protein
MTERKKPLAQRQYDAARDALAHLEIKMDNAQEAGDHRAASDYGLMVHGAASVLVAMDGEIK